MPVALVSLIVLAAVWWTLSARPRRLLDIATPARADLDPVYGRWDPDAPWTTFAGHSAQGYSGGISVMLPDQRALLWPASFALPTGKSVPLIPPTGAFMSSGIDVSWQRGDVHGLGSSTWISLMPTNENGFAVLEYEPNRGHRLTALNTLGAGTEMVQPGLPHPGTTELPLGFTRRGTALFCPPIDAGFYSSSRLTEITLREQLVSGAASPRSLTIQLPIRCGLREIALSPNGDRLAWLLDAAGSSPWPAWMLRWLPRPLLSSRKAVQVWLSDDRGRKFHEIGYAEAQHPTQPGGALVEVPRELAWSLDGKRLLYTYRDVRYSVPAD